MAFLNEFLQNVEQKEIYKQKISSNQQVELVKKEKPQGETSSSDSDRSTENFTEKLKRAFKRIKIKVFV